jgi:site-specific recombinase XerD
VFIFVMTPTKHKTGSWVIFIPAKMSATGKRQAKYFQSKNAAHEEIMRLKSTWRRFGTATFTEDERHYLAIARNELGNDLSRLPEVLRHWRLTGPDSITKTTVRDAIDKYLEYRASQDISRKTLADSRSALRGFRLLHDQRWLHEITAADVRAYIDEREPGGRKSAYKQMKLLLDYAKSERLIAVNPIDSIKAPTAKPTEVEVYRPEDFAKLLHHADAHYPDLVPYLALSGLGMLRTGELVSAYKDRPTLRWENIIYERNIVYVPELVAKQTRRATGNRREPPLNEALAHWLEPYRREEGPIVACSEAKWRAQLLALFKETGVRRLDNGLRKSAISYFIGRNPEVGVTLAARYAGNSEAISRTHYLAWITEQDGAAWFGIRRASDPSR